MKNHSFQVIFHFLDLKESNKYSSIKFETLFQESFPIQSEKLEINLDLNMINSRKGSYDEIIHLIPSRKEIEEKKYIISLNCDLNTIINININEEGNCGIEITSMWEVNYSDNINILERQIPDIEYAGKKIKNFEKLYERIRWNILNAKIENFGNGLFSNKTIEYIKKNKEKSYKYDIILNDDSKSNFLHEKVVQKKIQFLTENEKEELKKKINTLKSEIIKRIEHFEQITNFQALKNIKTVMIKSEYNNLEETFKIYNGKWDLDNFSINDFNLFLLFSELQIHFKEVHQNYRKKLFPKYEELKKRVISNAYLNLIEKARIICGFSKFCSSLLIETAFPEIVIFNELKDDDIYKLAVENYKNIINELKESSGFFKKLLLFDKGSSEIINEWDLENYEVENLFCIKTKDELVSFTSKFMDFKMEMNNINKRKKPGEKITKVTFPLLSMLTLNQLKFHLFDILPKFIFTVDSIYDFKAVSDVNNRISFFNDLRTFHLEVVNKEIFDRNAKEFILPLMIEISH